MPTQDEIESNRVELLVGGAFHGGWEAYECEADLLTPADDFNLKLTVDGGRLPAAVRSGAPVQLRVGGTLAMTGRIDRVRSSITKQDINLSISGRDLAGQLIDCSAPIATAQQITLEQVIRLIVNPFGITKVRIDATNALSREKISIEPGDKAWDALVRASEANGLWPWFEPDGTLVVGGPDYSKPPVAALVMRLPPNAGKNNVGSLQLDDCIADSYSEVTVLGQSHGGGMQRVAKHNIKGTYKDPSVEFYRPLIVCDHDVETQKHAEERARKIVMDSRLKRWTMCAEVAGHRINAPGEPGHGEIWAPGQTVHLVDETRSIDNKFFVMGRRFGGGRDGLPLTELKLKEHGVWIVAALPHKSRKRRRRGLGSGAVYDISNAPEAGK